MSKPTLASLAARIELLERQAAGSRAEYERAFFAAKKAEKEHKALRAAAPTSESPTFRQLLESASAQHGIPMHELTLRGGVVSHKGVALT